MQHKKKRFLKMKKKLTNTRAEFPLHTTKSRTVSEYAKETTQPQTADKPTTTRGSDTEHRQS